MKLQLNRNAMILFFVLLVFIALSVSFIYSSSAIISMKKFNDPWRFLKQQLFSIGMGTFLLLVAYSVKLEYIRYAARPLMLFTLLLLVLVFIPGIGMQLGRAHRWIKLGGFTFQPSELVKLALPLYLVDAICRKEKVRSKLVRGLIPLLLVATASLLLILFEPDFGTAVVLLIIVLTIVFIGGVALKYLAVLCFFLSIGLFFAVRLVPYRWKRIISFVDPFSDPYGKGYQILQSLKAFNKGGVWGVGPGNGSLKQGYLPEPYGDFIFAAIGEEIGLIGTLLIVGLYILFGYVGIRIGRQAPDKFSELLAYALVIVIVIQAFFNMAVTLGVVPTTGLTLPFISKGGSSLMVFMTICGILFNINKQPPLNKSIWEKGYVTST